MGNIVLLDELTINKIAAGEVIERPASVIKEMVENSIDANAKHVTVEIKNGGISFIRITDDGKGIERDDVEMAFERHATSKIRSADDLNLVKSMGFRGEALASIAAIANVELASKTENSPIGTRIVVEGGDVQTIDEIACTKGTTITVRNLFFNTPVRYKFLKKDFTESGYIEDIITRIALIHPEIAIKFINSGKTEIQTNGNGNLRDVIYTIYGKDIASNLIDVEYNYEYVKIKGMIGKPSIARSNRSNQMFFVNNRYVKDKTLSAAVEQAFKGMLPIGKFSFLVLNIEMPSEKVDVNVHPAKLEVRFAEEGIIFKAMFHAIKDSLLKEGFMSDREKSVEIKNLSKDAFKINNYEKIAENTYSTHADSNNEIDKTILESKEDEKIKANNINIENEKTSTIFENPIVKSNQDVFEKLKSLQAELKKEVEQNPELHLTDTYKELEQKYNNILNPVIEKDEKIEERENQTDEAKNNLTEEKLEETEPVEYIAEEKTEKLEEDNKNQENIINNEEIGKLEGLEEITENQEEPINKIEKEETINDIEYGEKVKNRLEDENQEELKNNIEYEESKQMENNLEEEKSKISQEEENLNEENDQEEDKNIETNEIENNNIGEIEENKENVEETKEKEELSFEKMYRELFGKEPYGGRLKVEEPVKKSNDFYTLDDNMEDKNVSIFEENTEYKKISYKFIGIAFNTYIILEIGNELYIMDQHAAHERIMYEKVKKNYYSETEKSSQMLLLPDLITLTNKEMNIAKDNFELFERAGFVLEEFGENTIKLSGVPEICVSLNTQELFKETLDEINTVARTSKQEKEEKFIATVACKAAVKANMALSKEEVDSLMSKLLELPNPFTCPHGRPTVIKMTKYEIERKFARK